MCQKVRPSGGVPRRHRHERRIAEGTLGQERFSGSLFSGGGADHHPVSFFVNKKQYIFFLICSEIPHHLLRK